MSQTDFTVQRERAQIRPANWIHTGKQRYVDLPRLTAVVSQAEEEADADPLLGEHEVRESNANHALLWQILEDMLTEREELRVVDYVARAREKTGLPANLILSHLRQYVLEGRVKITTSFTLTLP